MYTLFVSLLVAFVIFVLCCLFKRFRKTIVIIIASSIILACILSLHGAARAEEVRTCFIVSFDFETSCFIVEDEDGHLWSFFISENSYQLGEEYTLILPDNAEPYLVEEVSVSYVASC